MSWEPLKKFYSHLKTEIFNSSYFEDQSGTVNKKNLKNFLKSIKYKIFDSIIFCGPT